MTRIKTRLARLEARSGAGLGPIECVVLDGTEEEVKAWRAELEATGKRYAVTVIVPYKGQSVNEFRRQEGLELLDIAGGDEPR